MYMPYETRGSVKKKRGLYEEAIEDFLVVEEKMSDLITMCKHLKDCHEKVGNAKKAAFYAKRVLELLDKVDPKQRELLKRL